MVVEQSPKAVQNLFYTTVMKQISTILAGFDEAKKSINQVGSKNSHIKTMLDQLEKDLNALRNKSRRHQIQTNMNLASPASGSHSFGQNLLLTGPT